MSQQGENIQKKTSVIHTGLLPSGDFYIETEPPVGGFATDAGDNQGSFGGSAAAVNIDKETGLPVVCKTCQKPIFDIRKHRNPKGQRDDDDDRVLTLPPPECGRDDGLFRMCNHCSNYELPGSYHTDDSNDHCDPSVFASSRYRKETSFASGGGEAVIAKHQGGSSAFDNKKDVYSHEHRGYQRNCPICECVVYHPFGDVEAYCPIHNKHDRPWQD